MRAAAGPGPRAEHGPAPEAEPTVATASATASTAAGPERPTASTAPTTGAPPGDRSRPPAPRMVLDRTPGFVVRSEFEARRFVYAGAPVTDLTVRIAFRDGGRGHDTASIWTRLVEGVEEHFNRPGHRLAGGDRLHVTVLPARPGEHAHLTVDLVGRDRGMDQRSWWPDAEPVDYAHELGHQLGLRDEYRAPDLPHRPAVEGSMMGDYHRPAPGGLPQAGLRERHLRLISAVVGDLDAPVPAGEHHPSWAAARAAATAHSRAHGWADPVSDPLHRGRPTGSSAVAPRTHASPSDAGQGHSGSAAPAPGAGGHAAGSAAAGSPAAASGSGSAAQPDTSRNSVLMQPGYASGDQFGISVSLLHDPNMHVLIARGPEPGTPGHDPVQDKSRAIARFYRSTGIGADRIHFVDVPSMEKRTVWRALNGEATRIAQQDWGIEKSYDEMYQQGEIWGVTDGTEYVGQVFSDGLRNTVREAWGMTDAHDGRIGSWLEGRGIHLPPKDGKVLVLWSRFTGKATRWDDLRSRMEHDTSFQGIRQIVRDVGREYDAVIITGDPHPNPAKSDKWDDLVVQMRSDLGTDTVHHITGFWKGRGEELTSWGGDTRTGQFLLYDALHRHYRLDHLGFRSGNLEAVALLGHRVSYLEEAGAGGAARMAQWHDSGNGLTRGGGLAPGYERVIVPEPPTASGRYAQQFDVDGFAQDGRGYQPPDPNAWWRKPAEVYGQERGFGTRELDDIRAQLGLPDVSGARDRAGFFTDRVQHLRSKYETVRAEVVRHSGGGPQVEAYLSGYDRYFRTAPDEYHAGPEQLYHDLVQHGLPHLPQLRQYSRNLAYQAYAQQTAAHAQPSWGGDGLAPRAPASDSTGAVTGRVTGHAAGTFAESPAGSSGARASAGPEGPTPAGPAEPAEVAPRAPMTTGEHDLSGQQPTQPVQPVHPLQPAHPVQPPAWAAAGPAVQGHPFRYAEGAVEPDAAHFARADALAAEVVRAAVGRVESGLPLPRITVTGHGNGTVAGRPHFGRAMQVGKERAEALADLLVERIATHLGGHDTRLTTADFEVRTRSRGQLAPLGTDPAHLTAEERRQAVVTIDHPEPEPAAAAPADHPDGGTGGTAEARANAVRHGLGAETVDYLFGDGPRPGQTVAEIGEHPSWVEDRALGRWAAGVAMTPKYETLVALNRLTRSGEGPQGDTLLYLGANADIEHPLFTTRATRMTLIGVDPENLDAVTRKAHLDQVVGVMERSLRGYATPGHAVVRAETEPGRVTRLTVEGPDGPVLTVDYHAVTYDEYLHANPGERFDVVMDKDSWLLEWRSEQGVADAVDALLAQGGSWVGGTELGAAAAARFTRAPAERLGVGDPKWSGYQDLRLRTRTDRPAEPAAATAPTSPSPSSSSSDPAPTSTSSTSTATSSTSAAAGAGAATEARVGELFTGVMVAARDRFAFRGWTFDEAAYKSMLDDDLAYSLPYHNSFAGDEASVLANALALLPGVARRLSAEIATFAGTDGDFGARRILRDLAVLLDLDPDVLAPLPTGATGEEGA